MTADTEDHGADLGPAALARPATLQRVGGVYRGAAQRNATPVHAKRCLDAHLIDRMHHAAQLTAMQFKAAQRVLEMHELAGFEPSVTPGYAPPGWNRGHDDNADEDPAIARFRGLLGGCRPVTAMILHGMCLEQHPGRARLATLWSALDHLAKRWGLD